jgi:hypothetical protein
MDVVGRDGIGSGVGELAHGAGGKAYSLPISSPFRCAFSRDNVITLGNYPRLWTITPRAFRSWPPIASTQRRTHRMFPAVIFAI